MCLCVLNEEKTLHPFENRLCSALCCAGSSFRVVWPLLLWEVELINVWSVETQFLCPSSFFSWTHCTVKTSFSTLYQRYYKFLPISSIPLLSDLWTPFVRKSSLPPPPPTLLSNHLAMFTVPIQTYPLPDNRPA